MESKVPEVKYPYEFAAAKVFSIEVERLFLKTRNKEVVIARQFCMYYRSTMLKKSLSESASRYGKNHATCLHGNRKLKSYFKLYPEYKGYYDDFISKSNGEFMGEVYKKYSVLEEKIDALFSVASLIDGTFEAHEKAMLKYSEVEKALIEFKKTMISKWKEQ